MSRLDELIAELCPDGVEYKKLGSVISVERGKRVVREQLPSSGKYYVFQNSLTPLGYINEFNYPHDITFIIGAGAAGEIGFSYDDFWAADDCYPLVCSDIYDARFLYHLMLSKKEYISSQVRRGSIPRLSRIIIENMRIPVPPLPVQQEVVRILDHFTELQKQLYSELTAELTARKKQFEYYRNEMLKFDIPIKTLKIKDMCEISRGKVISKEDIKADQGIYPVFSSQTENNGELGRISSFAYDGEYLTWTTDGANAGTVFYRKGKFNITNVCGLLKVNNQLANSRFLYHLLSIEAPKYVNRGMGNPKLMSNVMGSIKVSIPDIAIQNKVANVLDYYDTICNDLSSGLPAEIAARQKQYEYYRDKLLKFKELKKS